MTMLELYVATASFPERFHNWKYIDSVGDFKKKIGCLRGSINFPCVHNLGCQILEADLGERQANGGAAAGQVLRYAYPCPPLSLACEYNRS